MGSTVSSLSWVWGGAPTEIEFDAFYVQNMTSMVATILMIFQKLYQPEKSKPK